MGTNNHRKGKLMKIQTLSMTFLIISLNASNALASHSVYLKCTQIEHDNSLSRNPKKPETRVFEIKTDENSQSEKPTYRKSITLWNTKISIDTAENKLFLTVKPNSIQTESSLSLDLNNESKLASAFLYVTVPAAKDRDLKKTIICGLTN